MKPKSYAFRVEESKKGTTLLDYLTTELPSALGVALSKSKIRKLIFAGAVYVEGSRALNVGLVLKPKSEVKAFVDLQKLQSDRPSQQKKIEITQSEVSYEDREIIVINKPAGVPTQATVDNSRDHLYAAVQRYLIQKDGPGAYCGLHHRLDYDTSGLILFTKKKSANFWVSELFKNRKISKTYHAIAKKNKRGPGDSWTIKNHIARAKNKGGGRVIHMEEVRSGGDLAHTEFTIIKNLENSLQLLECRPLTGRTHQIRIHLKLSQQPILGDLLYGGEKSTRIFLHAKSLQFIHGGTQKPLKIDSAYPIEMEKLIISR
jgi:23S rRNA pseudouridine1911/1915/1917 synthase